MENKITEKPNLKFLLKKDSKKNLIDSQNINNDYSNIRGFDANNKKMIISSFESERNNIINDDNNLFPYLYP